MSTIDIRDYQLQGSDFISQRGKAYLTDDAGLGKTLTVLHALHRIRMFPVIITASTVGLYTWSGELQRWFNEPSMIYTGLPHERRKLWKQFCGSDLKFLITTYGMLDEIIDQSQYPRVLWRALVQDEVHRAGILNRNSLTYKKSYKFANTLPVYIPLTGTPVRHNPSDLWAPLHAISPRVFPSYWKFVNEHCVVTKVDFDTCIEPRPRDPLQFHKFVSQFMLRRRKEDVLKELPPKTRVPLLVKPSVAQKRIYNQLANDMIAHDATSGNLIITPNSVARITRFRQLLVCPRILGVDDEGAAITAVADAIEDLFCSGRPAVIFTPYREAVPFFESYLKRRLSPIAVFKIHGGLTAKDVNFVETSFQTMTNPRRVVICVIKSGTSFQLSKASDSFFVGYEWSAIENSQSEDRLHRLGQVNNVTCNYCVHPGTIDDEILLKLDVKTTAENWTLRPQDMLKGIKKI